jgi:threonine/homoserine/homoserine lactone efflux protein
LRLAADFWNLLGGLGVLLAAPGPTNAAMAALGALEGRRAITKGAMAALSGYALAVGAGLSLVSAAASPVLIESLRLVGALWVGRLAWRLFRSAGAEGRALDARALFVTTLLNPKALILVLALAPEEGRTSADRLGLAVALAALVLVTSWAWGRLGARLSHGGRRRLAQGSAVVLAAFAVAALLRAAAAWI